MVVHSNLQKVTLIKGEMHLKQWSQESMIMYDGFIHAYRLWHGQCDGSTRQIADSWCWVLKSENLKWRRRPEVEIKNVVSTFGFTSYSEVCWKIDKHSFYFHGISVLHTGGAVLSIRQSGTAGYHEMFLFEICWYQKETFTNVFTDINVETDVLTDSVTLSTSNSTF